MRNEHIDNFPRKPVISRFVAPWDTSGWYGVWPDLQPGSRLYTNSEAQVAQLPEKYRGVPYIRTYNSNAEGFDDKQEVDFYVEQDAVVYAALDDRCVPDFLEQFQRRRSDEHGWHRLPDLPAKVCVRCAGSHSGIQGPVQPLYRFCASDQPGICGTPL